MAKTLLIACLVCSITLLNAQPSYELKILGTVQDGGSPHIGCDKNCCANLGLETQSTRKVSSLSIQNKSTGAYYVFDATPDFDQQIRAISPNELPSGIFLTHAHIGHYTGLMYLGREAKGAHKVPVYAMPKMKTFLENNGPWSQLVDLKNISIKPLEQNRKVKVEEGLYVTPIQVPHRDEFSETVGFLIEANGKKVLFIPDIDKWERWDQDITQWIKKVDLAFLDATFFDQNEVKRNMDEIPHPFVVESMKRFAKLSKKNKAKVHFIHLNHSNPLLDFHSEAYKTVQGKGFRVAKFHQTIQL